MALSKARSLLKNMIIKTLHLILLKCYHHLHLLFKNATIDQGVDEDCTLDIFEILTSTSNLANELVGRELLIFRRFQMSSSMVREAWIYVSYDWIPCPSYLKHCWFTTWNWFFKILNRILTNSRWHRLQSYNLNKLFLWTKIGPNDPRIGCNPFSNLLELIETNAELKEESKEFEKNIWKRWNLGSIIYYFKKNYVIFYSFFKQVKFYFQFYFIFKWI